LPHFTYKDKPNKEQLCQGDILQITDDLKAVFNVCHPYFVRDEYKYFIVLTQTCDLVKRKGACKSRYITIAAVRTLQDYLIRETADRTETYGKLVFLEEKKKTAVHQLLERVYNNNEEEHFFLAEDESFGFLNPMVAYLKVSIALKSELHYQTCLDAKILELTDEFKAKLGWLVGQMYSRVGTPDWQSENLTAEFSENIERTIKDTFIVGNKQQFKQLKNYIEEGRIDPNDLEAVSIAIEGFDIVSNQQKMAEVLTKMCDANRKLFASKESASEFIRKVTSSVQFCQLIKSD